MALDKLHQLKAIEANQLAALRSTQALIAEELKSGKPKPRKKVNTDILAKEEAKHYGRLLKKTAA